MYIFSINIFWIQISPTYYWLMYALGFLAWYYIIKARNEIRWTNTCKIEPISKLEWIKQCLKEENKTLESLIIYIFFWVILWWRLGYVLFYNFSHYIKNIVDIIKVWEWWMSFHWWVIWVTIAMILFSKKYKINFLKITDEVTAVLPIWLFFWRIWNYINKELLGFSPYNWPLAIQSNWISYFPSTLLEATLEWLILFLILNWIYHRNYHSRTSPLNSKNKKNLPDLKIPLNLKQNTSTKWFTWQIACLFLILYSIFRITVEIFFRMPDAHIWYIFWYLTMWEILTLPMLIFGIYYYNKFKKESQNKPIYLIK